ncbi:MAG: hypothetical protein BWY82_02587 [Verrucomicrobia bacterium ADurb.Bin474]|nr:MAG: hypothetical protein BWY82_02587 [Verrucomicrobia bacterium ADurb.Bin474]
MSPGQFHSQFGRCETGLPGTDFRVAFRRDIGSVALFKFHHVAGDDVIVLAVCGHERRACLEYSLEDLRIGYTHVSSGGTHEYFDAGDTLWIGPTDFLQIVVRGSQIESEVCMRVPCRDIHLLLPPRLIDGWRSRVRHFHVGGHTTCHCRHRLVAYAGLFGKSGFTKVNLVIDQPGNEPCPAGVDYFPFPLRGSGGSNGRDTSIFNNHIAGDNSAFVDDPGIQDANAVLHGQYVKDYRMHACVYSFNQNPMNEANGRREGYSLQHESSLFDNVRHNNYSKGNRL